MERFNTKTPLPSPIPDISPTPKISTAQFRQASPTARLPQLTLWDECITRTASSRPPHFDIYEWLGDACLNFSGHYFPDLSLQDANGFAAFFKTSICHDVLVKRFYIGNDKQTMAESIESHLSKVGGKSYSDFLEFYVGILLKSAHIDGCIVWNTIKEMVSVGLLYYISESKSPKELDDSARLSCDNTTSTRSNAPSNSESPPSLLRPFIDISIPSQSTESGQKTIASSETFLNQESVSKSACASLQMSENVECHDSITSPQIDSLTQASSSPNRSAPSQSIEFGQKAIGSSNTFLDQKSVSKSTYTPLSANENAENHDSVTSPQIESLGQASSKPDRLASSQSIESSQKAIGSSKTFLNQESVSKSMYTPLPTNENAENHGSVTSPRIESLEQASSSMNQSERRDSHKLQSVSNEIAITYRHFVFTTIIIDEILTLPNDEQASLYRCHTALNELKGDLRKNLNKLAIGLSLSDQNPAPLVASRRTLEHQMFEYLTTNALHSEILLKTLRDAKPVQEYLDNFRRQLKTIIQISRLDGRFKGSEGGIGSAWKIIGSDGTECFKGSFGQIRGFLLNPPAEVLQKCGNENKRKLDTNPSGGRKCSRKNYQSRGQGNKDLDRIRK